MIRSAAAPTSWAALHALHEPVCRLIEEAATRFILPRYRHLSAYEVNEKSPGEIVTCADVDAENFLTAALTALLPGARCVGEEAFAADGGRVMGKGEGAEWIIDPIDGTSNFVSGVGPFGTIIALSIGGKVEGGWIYDPVSTRICHAYAGAGAFINGQLVQVPAAPLRNPIAALATQFMPAQLKATLESRAKKVFDIVPIPRCAAEHYPRLALGLNDVAVFQRTWPWDHAAGALFLTEAGGRVTRWDGTPYRFYDDGLGILAAFNPEAWDRAAAVLGLVDFEAAGASQILPQSLDWMK